MFYQGAAFVGDVYGNGLLCGDVGTGVHGLVDFYRRQLEVTVAFLVCFRLAGSQCACRYGKDAGKYMFDIHASVYSLGCTTTVMSPPLVLTPSLTVRLNVLVPVVNLGTRTSNWLRSKVKSV